MKRLVVLLLIATAALPAAASAHPMPTSAVKLDIESHAVSGEVQIPKTQLDFAYPGGLDLRAYTRRHIHVTGTDGKAWPVTVGTAYTNRRNYVSLPLTLTPPEGKVTDFSLKYDVLIERLATHRAIATVRTQWKKGTNASEPETLGVYDWDHATLRVDADGGSWLQGFTSTVALGVEHIRTGADHLLFLLMLLIPAALATRRRVVRVVHVVTAFAIGHSITLALGALGVVHLPGRLVESLIALSIFVSAVHVVRPLVRRGEVVIAGGFGLVHGLAFATLLGDMGLHGSSLVASLFGFNLGIELTQLMVVGLMLPSLFVLSRTALYPAIRYGGGAFGMLLSGAWLLQRTGLIASDPFAAISTGATEHPLAVAAVLAAVAAVARYVPLRRAAVALSLVVLAGCGGDSEPASTTAATSTATATATSPGKADAAPVAAARAFLASLSDDQRSAVAHDLGDDALQQGWSNLPTSLVQRSGAKIEDLSGEQKAKLNALLRSVLSAKGYSQEESIRKADSYLAEQGGNDMGGPGGGGLSYGEGLYYVDIYGTPSSDGKWIVQFGGHHLAIHMTFDGSTVSNTPYFIGAEPQGEFELDGRTYNPMKEKADALYGAIQSLTDDQLARAKLSQSFNDVLVGPQQDGNFPAKEGVTVSSLSEGAQAKVTKAVEAYVGDMPEAQAKARVAAYVKQYPQTKIAWSGSTDPDTTGAYVRLHGPRLWLEICVQNGVVLQGVHYHSIERDVQSDYGGA